MNRLKKTLALSFAGALVTLGGVAAAPPASAGQAGWPQFDQYAPCWPNIHVTNYNRRAMFLTIEGRDEVLRIPANTASSFNTDLDKFRWSAVVGKGKGADRAGKGVFDVNADCPPA